MYFITASGILAPSDRQLIETVFETKVFNEYGSGEIGSIDHECEPGNMHIAAENIIAEIFDQNDKFCEVGEAGKIIITELNNRAMPLIRYLWEIWRPFQKINVHAERGYVLISAA
ncbi:MAG: hypothetical protein GY874_13060 [Desulfobacteraceae bacterium]|nr:hypothetical protein [Desulfobacteraceae bacterium]